MYGKRYVWIIIGWYEDKWWETKLNENHITCTTREMGEALERILGYRSHETQRGRCHFKAQNSIWMSEKSCSVRLVTGTVILRNSNLMFYSWYHQLPFYMSILRNIRGALKGKKVQWSFQRCLFLENRRENLNWMSSSSSNLKLSNIIRRNFMLITLRA